MESTMIVSNARKMRRLNGAWPAFSVTLMVCLLLCNPAHVLHAEEGVQGNQILVKDRDHPVISQRLQQVMERSGENGTVVVWVFFTDKGIFDGKDYEGALKRINDNLPERIKRRRAKMGREHVCDFRDVTVYQDYIDRIVSMSIRHRTTSKWFNGVSVEVEVGKLLHIARFPFVRKIDSVAQSKRIPLPDSREDVEHKSTPPSRPHTNGLNYGSSLNQLELSNVPAVHDLGYTGEGVIICILDTGFFLEHEALEHVDLIDQWDFIFNDGNAANEAEDTPSQHNHGSEVLSVIGGAKDGKLYGPAYGAGFLLAKTEDIRSETIVEEDYWVAGIEWADEMGADIATSSLGYSDWYEYEDYDGNTAITTRAADIAVSRGIAVCNSMGNNGQWAGSIVAPADGDSVISCGAVNYSGTLTGFSSSGPTHDGRTKPEVCAQGSSIKAAIPSTYKRDAYTSSASGTSFSTPLVAGCAALVLQAHPDWTPMQVREALKMTASRADQPDNNYGWGIVDCLKAVQYQQASAGSNGENPALPKSFALFQNYPNPFNGETDIRYQIGGGGYSPHTTLTIYNVLGQEVRTLVDGVQQAGYYSVSWDGHDGDGHVVSSGVYFYRLRVADFSNTKAMLLLK